MIKLIGAICVIAAGCAFGAEKAASRKRRFRVLSALASALDEMRLEITGMLTPMPDLISRMARSVPREITGFYARVHEGMAELGTESFEAIWERALRSSPELSLDREEQERLRTLGGALGRYSAPEQAGLIGSCGEFLKRRAEAKEAEAKAKCGADLGLGLAFGAMLAIMFV